MTELERPHLDLSGPKLVAAFERLVAAADEQGGIERYVGALQLKTNVFQRVLARELDPAGFKALCALIAPVRRRVAAYLEPRGFATMKAAIGVLLEGAEDTRTADARIAAFCSAFPADRQHRWVRDLAAELLHFRDPERYPLMCRWVWDAQTNTGMLREIWHALDLDRILINVPDRYATFVMLREELAQFLTQNGIYRDVMLYVDLLTAQVYGDYITEQGGDYLRASFNVDPDPLEQPRRLLGLDGIDARGRSKLKAVDGRAVVVDDTRLLS